MWVVLFSSVLVKAKPRLIKSCTFGELGFLSALYSVSKDSICGKIFIEKSIYLLGRFSLINPETRCPSGPWPSQTPKINRSGCPVRLGNVIKESWFGLTLLGILPALVAWAKLYTTPVFKDF